jgi:hypothetical protein
VTEPLYTGLNRPIVIVRAVNTDEIRMCDASLDAGEAMRATLRVELNTLADGLFEFFLALGGTQHRHLRERFEACDMHFIGPSAESGTSGIHRRMEIAVRFLRAAAQGSAGRIECDETAADHQHTATEVHAEPRLMLSR